MKKVIFLLLLAGFVSVSASAQKKITFGPKAGLAVTDLHANDDNENDEISGVKAGFVVGAFAEYRAVKWFALSADVLFARKGSENEFEALSAGVDLTTKNNIKLSYIDVPVLANFYVTKGLALKAGVQPSFLVGAKNKITETIDGDSNKKTTDLKDGMKTVDFAIPVGVSYTFNCGLVLDFRYNLSLTNVAKEADYKLKNRAAVLTVGWKF